MEFVKNILKKFPNDSFLNNLKEQGEGWYRNTEVPEDANPLFEKIADDLSSKINEVDFTDHDFPMHKFIDCNKELVNEFGVKIISACAYSGDEGVYTMDSNYIYIFKAQ